jgi:hypothetical protein
MADWVPIYPIVKKPIYQLLLPLYSSLSPSYCSAHLPARFVGILDGLACSRRDPPLLLPDGSSKEKFGSFFSQERALHRPYQSLDRFGWLRCILTALQVVCNLFRCSRPLLVCWLGVIFNVNRWPSKQRKMQQTFHACKNIKCNHSIVLAT